MATVPQFLHWEARPDFKEQTCQTKKQVWQHQRATKFGLPDYSTRPRGRVQRGRLNKGPKWLKASKNSVIPWKCLQFTHHKISSSHIEQEHSWEMLVTKSQNHPFCAGFQSFHRVLTVFSLPFQSFSRCHYFRKSQRCAFNFSSMGYLWGWDLPRHSLTKIWFPKSSHRENLSSKDLV